MKIIVEKPGTKISFAQGNLVLEAENSCREIPLLHVKSLSLQSDARISTRAIAACVDLEVPIYVEDDLRIRAMIWSAAYGSISQVRKMQALYALSRKRYSLIRRILTLKAMGRLPLIRSRMNKTALAQYRHYLEMLNRAEEDATLRSIEAHLSKLFYKTFKRLLPEGLRFEKREHRQAQHGVNIMLNYGYGMLYNYVTKALIRAGLDPFLPLFHAAQYNRPALSYDIVEMYRPWIERVVLQLIREAGWQGNQELLEEKGKLNREVKHRLIEHVTMYMEDKTLLWNGRRKTPETHIQLDAHRLARYLLKLDIKSLIRSIEI